jgi:hypothetical protein
MLSDCNLGLTASDDHAGHVGDHRLARGPAREEGEVLRTRSPAAHIAVFEAEEVKALASFTQVHDPRLGLLGRSPSAAKTARNASSA